VEVVGHQVDPVQRAGDARQFQAVGEAALGGGDGQQVMAPAAAFAVQARAQRFQQHGEIAAVVRAVADVGVAQGRVLPVDVQAVQVEAAQQGDAAVDEARTRRFGGRGLGEVAGAPAADGQHDLQRGVVGAMRDERVHVRRVDLVGQVHAAIGCDLGEGEVDHVQLRGRQPRRRRTVGHVADQAEGLRQCGGGECEQRGRQQGTQAAMGCGHGRPRHGSAPHSSRNGGRRRVR